MKRPEDTSNPAGGSAVLSSEDLSFEELLSHTCDRLWDKKVQYSLTRLEELDGLLGNLERELDEALTKSRQH
jgi:hypothetical protein